MLKYIFIQRNIYMINDAIKLTEIEFSDTIEYKVENLKPEDIYIVSYMSPEILSGEYDFRTDIWYYFYT
jgi:hypothetical protein